MAVLIIFPLILRRVSNVRMLSTGEQEVELRRAHVANELNELISQFSYVQMHSTNCTNRKK